MKEIFNVEKLLDIFNYIFWFLLLNIFFMVFNLPLIFFILSVGINHISEYFPLFLLCLIPFAPSLTVLIYCMGKIIKYKDLNLFKDLFNGLKINFKQSFLLWCGELALVFILYTNIKFFSSVQNGKPFIFLFTSFLIILFLVTPYIYLLISRFSMKSFDLIKSSIILTFTRPILTLSNAIIIIIPLILFEFNPGTVILFISSILAFLMSFSNKSLLEELEVSAAKTSCNS